MFHHVLWQIPRQLNRLLKEKHPTDWPLTPEGYQFISVLAHLTVYQHFNFTLEAHFSWLCVVFFSLTGKPLSYFPCNLRRKSNQGNFCRLKDVLFNKPGPLSGLNVKQMTLLARYSILLTWYSINKDWWILRLTSRRSQSDKKPADYCLLLTSDRVQTDSTSCNTASDKLTACFKRSKAYRMST